MRTSREIARELLHLELFERKFNERSTELALLNFLNGIAMGWTVEKLFGPTKTEIQGAAFDLAELLRRALDGERDGSASDKEREDKDAPREAALKLAYRLYRALERSAAIMRNNRRTGGWNGAERVAAAFDRDAVMARSIHALLAQGGDTATIEALIPDLGTAPAPTLDPVDRGQLASWCRAKAEFYRAMRDGCKRGYDISGERWSDGRMQSFLETADMLDRMWDFTKRPV